MAVNDELGDTARERKMNPLAITVVGGGLMIAVFSVALKTLVQSLTGQFFLLRVLRTKPRYAQALGR
jgi:hypothetical protein